MSKRSCTLGIKLLSIPLAGLVLSAALVPAFAEDGTAGALPCNSLCRRWMSLGDDAPPAAPVEAAAKPEPVQAAAPSLDRLSPPARTVSPVVTPRPAVVVKIQTVAVPLPPARPATLKVRSHEAPPTRIAVMVAPEQGRRIVADAPAAIAPAPAVVWPAVAPVARRDESLAFGTLADVPRDVDAVTVAPRQTASVPPSTTGVGAVPPLPFAAARPLDAVVPLAAPEPAASRAVAPDPDAAQPAPPKVSVVALVPAPPPIAVASLVPAPAVTIEPGAPRLAASAAVVPSVPATVPQPALAWPPPFDVISALILTTPARPKDGLALNLPKR